MLENVNLEKRLSREEYQASLPALQRRLYDLEKACWDGKVASVVVFEGWDASGKGGAIQTLTQRLDPRGFKLYSIELPRTSEQNRPWLWRFWQKVPNHGEMVILDRSWYMRVLDERVEKLVPEKVAAGAHRDIVEFERMLADDGTAVLKFFFHISRREQKRRFKKLKENPLEAWRVTEAAWRQNRKYDEYLLAVEEMLELTESEFAPWTILEATSKWHARKRVFETVIAALEERLGDKAPPRDDSDVAAIREADLRDAMATLEDGDGNGEPAAEEPAKSGGSHQKDKTKTKSKAKSKRGRS